MRSPRKPPTTADVNFGGGGSTEKLRPVIMPPIERSSHGAQRGRRPDATGGVTGFACAGSSDGVPELSCSTPFRERSTCFGRLAFGYDRRAESSLRTFSGLGSGFAYR